jgi:hypothetical protein
MCFNIYWSSGFSLVGLIAAAYVKSTTSNGTLAFGVFFFFLMEFLQVVQYLFISPSLDSPICDTTINQVLTVLGFLHISLQPYFLHSINGSLLPVKTMSRDKLISLKAQYHVVKKLAFLGGMLLFARWPMSFIPGWNTLGKAQSTEWLRGHNLCTYKTGAMYHLGWSVPMADPTYNIMGTGIHSFLMFAPFLALSDWNSFSILFKGLFFQGIVCYCTGPLFAAYLSPNLQEQASIWCLFSIAQIMLMLVRVYSGVRKNYPRGEKAIAQNGDRTPSPTTKPKKN